MKELTLDIDNKCMESLEALADYYNKQDEAAGSVGIHTAKNIAQWLLCEAIRQRAEICQAKSKNSEEPSVLQKLIMGYIDSRYKKHSYRAAMIGTDKVSITDNHGQSEVLTVNLFGDIINAETGRVYAEGYLQVRGY